MFPWEPADCDIYYTAETVASLMNIWEYVGMWLGERSGVLGAVQRHQGRHFVEDFCVRLFRVMA